MKGPENKPEVKLTDGNAFAVIGKVTKALKRAGADSEFISAYIADATSGDYDHLLQVSMEVVDVS